MKIINLLEKDVVVVTEEAVFYLVDREVARACRRGDVCYLGDEVKRKGKLVGHKGLVFSVVRAALSDFMYG